MAKKSGFCAGLRCCLPVEAKTADVYCGKLLRWYDLGYISEKLTGFILSCHEMYVCICHSAVGGFLDSKVNGANMGPTWGRQDPGGPHVGPMNFAIWVSMSYDPGNIWNILASSLWCSHEMHVFICYDIVDVWIGVRCGIFVSLLATYV